MFGQMQPTPYDVTFSVSRIPVRILPTFWLGATLLNWRLIKDAPELMILWILCVLVSILLHELGHAFVQRYFGYWPHIMLHHFGGYAAYQPDSRLYWWKSLLIAAAGPAVQLVLFGLLMILILSTDVWMQDYRVANMVNYMFFINLVWPIFNLLPIYPLDGGQIADALFRRFTSYNAFRNTRWLSIVTCVFCLLLVFRYFPGSMLMPIFFIILAIQNYQELQGTQGW